MISLTVVLFDCESESDHCFLKGVLIFVFVSQIKLSHQEKTKALTGNTSKGFQVETRYKLATRWAIVVLKFQ